MDWLQAIALGVIQGATEFLPVSSSGHLVLVRHLFGLTEPVLFFDTSVHVGTMLAVILVFRHDLKSIGDGLLALARGSLLPDRLALSDREKTGLRLALLVIVGSVPTAVIGLCWKVLIAERYFVSLYLVGAMLIVTAGILWMTRGRGSKESPFFSFSGNKGFWVGCAQGMAVLPGISRSGATIAAALLLGIDRETAARFSFLLSIPAIIGAELISAGDLLAGTGKTGLEMTTLIGTGVSFAVGYLALKMLLAIVNSGKLHLFAPYCLAAGMGVLALAQFRL